jgi:hypothetical protein
MSEPWLSTHIERWPTAKLVPYARNARTHSDEQVAQIAASIVEFGFTNPILAGSDGVIVAGHGRLAAAQKLGLDTVPVVVLDHLTLTQRRALIIADNRIAENAGWDDAMLRIELQSLQEDGFNLDITGFDADALAEIMAGEETTVDGQTDDDAVPDVPVTPISRPGDVWELGSHRLLCGDAADPASYEALMADSQADMVFTDPPYNVDYANSAKDKMRGKDRPILNDNLGDGFYDFLLAALTPMLERCAGATYIAMSSSWIRCSKPSGLPVASGRPSSSGPRTPSRLVAPTTSASMSPSYTAGPRGKTAIGAVIAIRVMSGTSRSRRRTICTRP